MDLPDGSQTPAPQPHSSFVVKRIVVLLLIVACTAGALYLYKSLSSVEEPQISNTELRQEKLDALYANEALPVSAEGTDPLNYALDDTVSADGISGHLIFTGLSFDEITNQVYFIDMKDEGSKPALFFPEFAKYSAFLEVADRVSPTEFFVNAMHYGFSRISETKADQSSSFQRYNMNEGYLQGYESITGEYAQNLAWSSSTNKVAYNRLTQKIVTYSDLVPIDSWEVVISDIETDQVVAIIDDATQPKWSPDGTKLMVLKSDGLYLYDMEKRELTRIVETTEGEFLATSMLDVSPDGTHYILTAAKAGVIIVNQITSWEPFASTELGRIHVADTEYYWPQFSADGQYYVVQAVDAAKQGEVARENPRFEVRGTSGREILRTFSLKDFDFNSLFTDTWIQTLPERILTE